MQIITHYFVILFLLPQFQALSNDQKHSESIINYQVDDIKKLVTTRPSIFRYKRTIVPVAYKPRCEGQGWRLDAFNRCVPSRKLFSTTTTTKVTTTTTTRRPRSIPSDYISTTDSITISTPIPLEQSTIELKQQTTDQISVDYLNPQKTEMSLVSESEIKTKTSQNTDLTTTSKFDTTKIDTTFITNNFHVSEEGKNYATFERQVSSMTTEQMTIETEHTTSNHSRLKKHNCSGSIILEAVRSSAYEDYDY